MQAGHELDALVAEKVMGWIKLERHPCPEKIFPSPITGWVNPGPWLYHPDHTFEKGGDMNGQAVPEYSTDIVAAWEMVEKIEAFAFHLTHDGLGWLAEFVHEAFSDVQEAAFHSRADTAPLAICLAALALKGINAKAS